MCVYGVLMGFELGFCEFGEVFYELIWYVMQCFVVECDKLVMDEVWLLQYFVVFIQGQVGKVEYVLFFGDILVIQVDCGGQVIYYGFGQLVIYLLFDVCCLGLGVCELVSWIEQSLIGLLVFYDVQVVVKLDVLGVYVDGVKIVFFGLCICNGCFFYGLVLNLDMDL